MDITVTRAKADSDECRIDVAGALDLTSRGELTDAANDALGDPACQRLVIRLNDVTFVDSTGVGALVEIRNDAEDADKQLVLSDLSVRVKRIFDVSGVTPDFSIDA